MGIKIVKVLKSSQSPKGGLVTLKKFAKAASFFVLGEVEEASADKAVLGGKAFHLNEMLSAGFPVPPGAVIPARYSVRYQSNPSKVMNSVSKALPEVVKALGGSLVSVRSGARVSMPGMMDTILNVGITQDNLYQWKEKLGDRQALDCYRRFLQMFGSVALGIPADKFEAVLEAVKAKVEVSHDTELGAPALEFLVNAYIRVYKFYGKKVPATVEEQLSMSVEAVFKSWNNDRAKLYRKMYAIPEDWGTAVTIQKMVYGNLGEDSATGVVFSRCPATGKQELTGEFLVNAQGEDVVAGVRTPMPLSEMAEWNPSVAAELKAHVQALENHFGDMQDVEFTVENGTLWILQTRAAKRTARAVIEVAMDYYYQGEYGWDQVKSLVSMEVLKAAMTLEIDPSWKVAPNVKGIAAGGGVVSGVAVFSASAAVNCTEDCILLTKETTPDDLAGMEASVGILTATGGLTSHAAVVGRGMNKVCVVGATDLKVANGEVTYNGVEIKEGDKLTIDGFTGNVWHNVEVPTVSGLTPNMIKFMRVDSGITKAGDKIKMKLAIAGSTAAEMVSGLQLLREVSAGGHLVITKPTQASVNALWADVALGKFDSMIIEFEGSGSTEADIYFLDGMVSDGVVTVDLMSGAENVPANVAGRVVVQGLKGPAPAKFKSPVEVKTVADLMEGGACEVTPEVLASVFGGESAYLKLVGILKNSGVQIEAPVTYTNCMNFGGA